ncbi:phosphoprotein phosphatase methylesterase 1 [Nakaseomyces bracarensis]|uniref:phosphoprotein phosphatase methylesterase 1 n=1 Tax=Nakaseomyces bracarensis TaxID=273131 RepID=UPI00387249E1
MSDNLRKNILLRHLDEAGPILQNLKYEKKGSDDEAEEFDDISELPSLKQKFNKVHLSNREEAKPEVTWDKFFEYNEVIQIQSRNLKFNTYYSFPKETGTMSIPIFVFHHGAGSSGLTFANLAKHLREQLNDKCGLFSFDARNHGETVFMNDDVKKSYSRDEFADDFCKLLDSFISDKLSYLRQEKLSIILVGHSLGGSISTFSFEKLNTKWKRQVIGVAMFDIVEEAAISALEKVDHYLKVTPNLFSDYNEAVTWHMDHNLSRCKESAEVAIPALFRPLPSGKVVRRTDLKTFSPYWGSWFGGLSKKFVSLPTSKLLIIAGNDNLDKDLIIGQMQGKYQLVVFQESGHFIQEDAPKKTAITLIDFWKRNDNKNVVIKSNWGSAKK